LFCRNRPGICTLDEQLQVSFGTQSPHEGFVGIGFFTPQLMVEMCCSNNNAPPISEAQQDIEHDDRINASADRSKNAIARLEQSVLADVLFDGMDEVMHDCRQSRFAIRDAQIPTDHKRHTEFWQ
jgi:hypothetical protein